MYATVVSCSAVNESKQRRRTGYWRRNTPCSVTTFWNRSAKMWSCYFFPMNSALRLYRRVLKLHKHLPLTSKALGDQYVKNEFRRHKNANADQITKFIQEWKVCLSVYIFIIHARILFKFISYRCLGFAII